MGGLGVNLGHLGANLGGLGAKLGGLGANLGGLGANLGGLGAHVGGLGVTCQALGPLEARIGTPLGVFCCPGTPPDAEKDPKFVDPDSAGGWGAECARPVSTSKLAFLA